MEYDFTLSTYRQLLETIQSLGYTFITFAQWCERKTDYRYVIMRHDVDQKAGNSLATAKIEASMGIRATYYFRITPQSNKPEVIQTIAALGHEIGYHYEDLSLFNGDENKAIEHFEKQLEYFRGFSRIKTICMHGSPLSKFDNRAIWENYSYKKFGIVGEPYFDFLTRSDVMYFTDTARRWDGDKYNVRDKKISQTNDQDHDVQSGIIHSTFDLIDWFQKNTHHTGIMISTHPQRWTNNPIEWTLELILQALKNKMKSRMIKLRS